MIRFESVCTGTMRHTMPKTDKRLRFHKFIILLYHRKWVYLAYRHALLIVCYLIMYSTHTEKLIHVFFFPLFKSYCTCQYHVDFTWHTPQTHLNTSVQIPLQMDCNYLPLHPAEDCDQLVRCLTSTHIWNNTPHSRNDAQFTPLNIWFGHCTARQRGTVQLLFRIGTKVQSHKCASDLH
jgi:hypothetical protein